MSTKPPRAHRSVPATVRGAPEPCSFERYAEVMGAQAAWANSGADVVRKLCDELGLSVNDVSRFGAYWATRFAADPRLALEHAELSHVYEQTFLARRK